MDFTKITKNDIEIALQKLRAGEVPHAYLPSTDYDVEVNGEKFPPKQVIAFAYQSATGELPLPKVFKGGDMTPGFKILHSLGYKIIPKQDTLRGAWIFQGNPKTFRVDDYLNSRVEFYWTVKQYKKIIKIGDIVYIWRSGKRAGIVVVAQVTSHVEIVSDDSTDYWIQKPETNSAETERVKLKILERRVDNPLFKDDVKVRLPDWSFIKSPQGTNFKVSIEQAEIINNLLGFKKESISTVETEGEDDVQDAESQQKDKEIQNSVEKVKSDQELLDLINKIESKLISAPLREKKKTAYAISRNPTIAKLIKQRAGYRCELCGEFGFEKKMVGFMLRHTTYMNLVKAG